MQQPAPFQGGINVPVSQDNGERNAVWERKRQAYLAQRAPASPLGKGAAGLPVEPAHGLPSHPNPAALPPSSNPLTYDPPAPASYQNHPPPQVNNPAHFQQEWENSVADQTKRYQQQNDPSFTKTKKATGYSVSKPPGGHSSIDLGWHEPNVPAPKRQNHGSNSISQQMAAAAIPAGGNRQQYQQYHHQEQEPCELPSSHGGSYQNRGAPFALHDNVQRAVGGGNNARQASVDRTQACPYAWDHSQDQAPRGGASGSYSVAPQRQQQLPPPQRQERQQSSLNFGGGDPPQQQGYAYGRRLNESSSNRFANGDNQNSGNVISERSSTRIAAPPGGHSNFTFY